MRRPPATPVPPRRCTESEEVRSFWFHSVHTTASGSLPECGVCVPKDVRALLPHPAYEVGHSQVCPPCTDGPQIAGILSHDVDQCHGRVPFTLPPAPNACAQVRLTDSGRSDMPALAAHGRAGACGARGAARPSPVLWRAPMVRQKREEGGGDLGRRMWRAGGRARRRLGRRRLVNEPRSPCRGARTDWPSQLTRAHAHEHTTRHGRDNDRRCHDPGRQEHTTARARAQNSTSLRHKPQPPRRTQS